MRLPINLQAINFVNKILIKINKIPCVRDFFMLKFKCCDHAWSKIFKLVDFWPIARKRLGWHRKLRQAGGGRTAENGGKT